jgi:Astacin (Peptidase family M12A)
LKTYLKLLSTIEKVCFNIPKDDSSITNDDDIVRVGDMLLTRDQYDSLYSNNAIKRNGHFNTFEHWPEGVIPFKISRKGYTTELKQRIFYAMEYIMEISCIKFKFFSPSKGHIHYLLIQNNNECASSVSF